MKLLPLEILSLKPSGKKTKMYFLKQYFQQKQKRNKNTKEEGRCVISSGRDRLSFFNEAKGTKDLYF